MANNEEFVPPPEAPIFEPTEEEFKNPLAYIYKIHPIAVNVGICKIRPPPNWQSPFCCDVDKFNFTPRRQRLNELEARSRVKLNFLEELAKFSELRGFSFRIPTVDKKFLDLTTLYKIVVSEGGFETVCKERKWGNVLQRMGCAKPSYTSVYRNNYERILYPYEVFKREKSPVKVVDEDSGFSEDKDKQDSKREPIPPRAVSYRRSKRVHPINNDFFPDVESITNSSELKRLAFFGAGPKMNAVSLNIPMSPQKKSTAARMAQCQYPFESTSSTGDSPMKADLPDDVKEKLARIESYVCAKCSQGDDEDHLLLCDGCERCYHTFCLLPPLHLIPKGDWQCLECIERQVSKPKESFGFEQSKREYTLHSFGDRADQFKQDYFNLPAHMVPCEVVEKEYWRLVNTLDENVVVEYGADLHTLDHGSGFPTEKGRHLLSDSEQTYIDSQWNLNNLSVHKRSLLRYVKGEISGMKVPWAYVGMCFSSFCWHTEDHWSNSINYLHWGEPKTWYGVPSAFAEALEGVMKAEAPELFDNQPDLLHHLVTIMNPSTLIRHGIPVVRTNQHAGEFIVTFPRAYHAGFNQGYNFAEAVNFLPADWLPFGRQCIDHYRSLRRQCVFSHDELMCEVAKHADDLDSSIATIVYKEMLLVVDEEKNLRKGILDRGTSHAKPEHFENMTDDQRQCAYCHTTLFLSAISCECSPDKMVCLYHPGHLCECDPAKHLLKYQFTLDELAPMALKLKVKAEMFEMWATRANAVLHPGTGDKPTLGYVKDLIVEAEKRNLPALEAMASLKKIVVDAEKCSSVCHQLLSKKRLQRSKPESTPHLTFGELNSFFDHIRKLPCRIPESHSIEELMAKLKTFRGQAKAAILDANTDVVKLEKLLSFGLDFNVEFDEIPVLKQHLQQVKWLQNVKALIQDNPPVGLQSLELLIESAKEFKSSVNVDQTVAELQNMLEIGSQLEGRAKSCLEGVHAHSMEVVDQLLKESRGVDSHIELPMIHRLTQTYDTASAWVESVKAAVETEHSPYLDRVEKLVSQTRNLPIQLEQLAKLEGDIDRARAWKTACALCFVKPQGGVQLIDALTPRHDVTSRPAAKRKGRNREEREEIFGKAPMVVWERYRDCQEVEVEAMRKYRILNVGKLISVESADPFCVCRKRASGFMIQCGLCRDWFHQQCVKIANLGAIERTLSTGADLLARFLDRHFLCPNCSRSERPTLEAILKLLVNFQSVSVRVPEGEALQCLAERAMRWQDRAQSALSVPEVCRVRGADGATRAADHAYTAVKSPSAVNKTDNPLKKHLDEPIREQLEELLLEGNLIEVSMEETSTIWKVIRSTASADSTTCFLDPSLTDEPVRFILHPKTARKRPGISDASGRTKKTRTVSGGSTSEDESDWEHCASSGCLRPAGEGIDWVACDSCRLWFHFVCIGLATELSAEDEYICEFCVAREEETAARRRRPATRAEQKPSKRLSYELIRAPQASATQDTPQSISNSDRLNSESLQEASSSTNSRRNTAVSWPSQSSVCASQTAVSCPSQTAVSCPSQIAVSCPSQTAVSCPSQTPVSCPSQTPVSCPSQTAVSCPSQTAVSYPSQTAVSCPSQTAVSCPSQTAVSGPPSQTPVSFPSQTAVSCPSQTAVSCPSQTAVSCPSQTAVSCPSLSRSPRLLSTDTKTGVEAISALDNRVKVASSVDKPPTGRLDIAIVMDDGGSINIIPKTSS